MITTTELKHYCQRCGKETNSFYCSNKCYAEAEKMWQERIALNILLNGFKFRRSDIDVIGESKS